MSKGKVSVVARQFIKEDFAKNHIASCLKAVKEGNIEPQASPMERYRQVNSKESLNFTKELLRNCRLNIH